MMNFKNIEAAATKKSATNDIVDNNNEFNFGIETLDNHIATVLKNTEASYPQISLVALAMNGFILSHGGIKNTSLSILDFSDSGTGKSHNISMQSELLLKSITQAQDNLQLLCCDDEPPRKRYINIHRGKITVPALFQCIATVPSQLIIVDELGLLLQKDDDLISEVTKLYGATEASIPVLKTEVPSSRSIVPVSLSFIGATTLSYFGSTTKLSYHTSGGFVNRAFMAYNKRLKTPEEITSIAPSFIDYVSSNKKSLELLEFSKTNIDNFMYSEKSEEILLRFKKEIQAIKITFATQGNNEHSLFYNRTFQNTQTLVHILHGLKCFEKKTWLKTIDTSTIETAISFVKTIVFPEIEKIISYLSDDELLEKEEKRKLKIIKFVDDYLLLNSKMPKIRDVTQKTRLKRKEILDLTKGYLELIPGTTMFQYCNR